MERTVRGARIVARALVEAETLTNIEVLTGGTDVHQVVLDTKRADVDATEALELLHGVSINANAMRIGHDARPRPFMSGLRLGTASLATRGFDDDAFGELGAILCDVLSTRSGARRDNLATRTAALASAFPGYVGAM
jgi:glycine hydroxymethyltransferase